MVSVYPSEARVRVRGVITDAPPEATHTAYFRLRMEPERLDLLRHLARLRGVTASALVRELVEREAQTVASSVNADGRPESRPHPASR